MGDERKPRINTDEHGLRSGEITQAIIGCAMEVLNTLGHGMAEKLYENSLVVEFELRNIPSAQQSRFDVLYKGRFVGEYIPDLIVSNEVIVDTKTIDRIGDHEIGQMINYLRITGLRVGLVINFKHATLEWKRVCL